jgi:FdhE protein
MQRTTPGLRADSTARLADLERRRPEWQTWLTLLGEAEHALNDSGWRIGVASGESRVARGATLPDEPLLHRRTLQLDSGRVQRLLRHLVATAATGDVAGQATLSGYRPSKADAIALLMAAVRQDGREIGALAAAAGVDSGALTSVAHLMALPLLRSCGQLLEDQIPSYWARGYCPICAAWPIIAERRGLDRTRRLRCGRCGSEWEMQWLCCVYCGNREHERLGSLILEEQGERLKVETCAGCRGYLKSVATLQAIPHFELLVQDLETIELDLVALDRGYQRPPGLGFALEVHVVDHASG